MTNVVTLELTGDEASLEDAIQRATQQVKGMDDAVGTAASSVETSSGRMDRMAERADNLATRTGTLAGGIGALAGGMALLGVDADSTAAKIVGGLSVAIGTLSGVADIAAIALTSQKVALVAHKVATVASSAATGVATGAQWAYNTAMTVGLGPILLVVAGVGLLIAAIVVIATKTTWFQGLWRAAWGGVKSIAAGFVDWFSSIPDRIGGFFSSIGAKVSAPFRSAFNFIADAWNNTVGRLQWSVPSWVPIIGGNTVGAPRLPHFHSGGMVTGPGPIGAEVLGVLRVGERVLTREQQTNIGGTTNITITVNGNRFRDGTDFEDWLDELRNDSRGGEAVTE